MERERQAKLQKMLSTTNVQIKRAIQILNIGMGKKDLHRDLVAGQTMQVNLLPGVNVYCVLETKDCRTPLTLIFDYKTESQSDLQVYASFKHKLPEKEKCDFSMNQA